jgi:metal-responsive CopG/Arc/MetJ family transcriptional regulator
MAKMTLIQTRLTADQIDALDEIAVAKSTAAVRWDRSKLIREAVTLYVSETKAEARSDARATPTVYSTGRTS